MQITTKAHKLAAEQAQIQTNKIKTHYHKWSTWDQMAESLSLEIPEDYRKEPYNYANVSRFAQFWLLSFPQRLELTLSGPSHPSSINKLKVDHNTTTFHTATLKPEQEPVFRTIVDKLYTRGSHSALLQDGYTGAGKTYIGGAVIAQIIANGIMNDPNHSWKPYVFLIICPKAVTEIWYRKLEEFGLGQYLRTRKICIFPDSSFGTDEGKLLIKDEEDLATGIWYPSFNPIFIPPVCLIDECHRFVRPTSYRFKCLEALIEAPTPPKFLFLSATPMECVNDGQLFMRAAKTVFMGTKVTKKSFKYVANCIDTNDPAKPNREAMKRLRGILNDCIVSIPYVKPKFKAINIVQPVPFRNNADQLIYATAHQRYIDTCKKLGKDTSWGSLGILVALNNYLRTVEPLRSYYIAAECAKDLSQGLAPVIGCAYKETIIRVVLDLVDNCGISRNRISVIWGGRKQFKPEDLLSPTEMDRILNDPEIIKNILEDKSLIKKIKTTLRYRQDQYEHSESGDEQLIRMDRLRELRLAGSQSPNTRQIEIDKFQSGETDVCIFTLATGGLGLSLDKDKPQLKTRKSYLTPVYSGRTFMQAMGRTVRRGSMADCIQSICMMIGTVEIDHVAPILDAKMKSTAEITNRTFDITDLLMTTGSGIPTQQPTLRDINEAAQDADKDDIALTDVAVKDDEDDEEDDEAALDV